MKLCNNSTYPIEYRMDKNPDWNVFRNISLRSVEVDLAEWRVARTRLATRSGSRNDDSCSEVRDVGGCVAHSTAMLLIIPHQTCKLKVLAAYLLAISTHISYSCPNRDMIVGMGFELQRCRDTNSRVMYFLFAYELVGT